MKNGILWLGIGAAAAAAVYFATRKPAGAAAKSPGDAFARGGAGDANKFIQQELTRYTQAAASSPLVKNAEIVSSPTPVQVQERAADSVISDGTEATLPQPKAYVQPYSSSPAPAETTVSPTTTQAVSEKRAQVRGLFGTHI